ncbi:M13 family metallopeptidase [Lacticaseibacillus paracasei]|uniref:M13 family metallopeptidase n=1 Tax=Lacticaseibacillus paracasei TaxID=1597 RepID=UPI0031D2BF9B
MSLPRIQDDLYMAVNGTWQQNTVIPPDKSVVSADSDLTDSIRIKLVADLKKINAAPQAADSPLQNAARLFAKANDKVRRNQLGMTPVRARLDKIAGLKTLAQFRAALPKLLAEQYVLPVSPYVDADMHDAAHNILNLGGPATILPDAAMYQTDDAENAADLAAWSKMVATLLGEAGFDQTAQAHYVAAAKSFDRRLAAFIPANVDFAVDSTFDNPLTWTEFVEDAGFLGIPEAWEKHAFGVANDYFDDAIGQYYGQTYFGADAKADITAMVKEILQQYQVQLEHNTWLSPATKQKAIRKLATMKIKMGYPDQLFPLYATLHVEPEADLLPTILQLSQQTQDFWLQQVGQPVDRNVWGMPGHLVNACYDPMKNDITFPAGILQPPYYSLNWTRAQNLGGTGATIGHEISHSFDNNGALYDEYGTLNNWWTVEDKQAFDKLVTAIADQFDGLLYEGVKVNGRLTVSENIADNAGMAVALDLLGDSADPKVLQDFFIAYARSWATKMRPERAKTVLRQDVHAPATLRVNVPVQNFEAWYQAFDVQPTDGMYRLPAKRVTIWRR